MPSYRARISTNTTAVFRVRRKGIDKVLRCVAKTNTPPSTRRHQLLSDHQHEQGLVWGTDADTPLVRASATGTIGRAAVARLSAAARP
jgi:hypothetical protein